MGLFLECIGNSLLGGGGVIGEGEGNNMPEMLSIKGQALLQIQ